MKMDMETIVDFFFETGILKNTTRSGWQIIGIDNPENVSGHSHRSTIIGYVLAMIEGADSNKVIKMCMIHDLPEARITDLHKIAQRYIDTSDAENKAFFEQCLNLPIEIKNDLTNIFNEFQENKTKEANIANDAEHLECAFQAKEYIEKGHDAAWNWINNVEARLKTDSAKKILNIVKEKKSTDWWQGLKKID